MFPAVFRSYRRIKNHSYVEINLRKYRFFKFHFPGNAGDSLSYHRGCPVSPLTIETMSSGGIVIVPHALRGPGGTGGVILPT